MSSLNISSQAHIASQSVILGDVTIGADYSITQSSVATRHRSRLAGAAISRITVPSM